MGKFLMSEYAYQTILTTAAETIGRCGSTAEVISKRFR